MSISQTVLFICTGNTCRSPMAEGLLKAALKGRENVRVVSAGVAAMPGQPASPETRDVLQKNEADLPEFRSQQVDQLLLKSADWVIAMTASHADVLMQYFPVDAPEVHLLTDFINPDECLSGSDVADPIGMGKSAYEEVAEVMRLAMPGVIAAVEGGGVGR